MSPKYRASVLDKCLTSPRRFVPVDVRGRRTSYSDRPSSFQSMTSRTSRRSLWRYSLAKASSIAGAFHVGAPEPSRISCSALLGPAMAGSTIVSDGFVDTAPNNRLCGYTRALPSLDGAPMQLAGAVLPCD